MARRHFHPAYLPKEVVKLESKRHSSRIIPDQETKYKESEAVEVYRHIKELARLTSWQKLDGLTHPILNLIIQAKIPFEVGDFKKVFGAEEWVYASLIKGEHTQGIKIFEQETSRTPILYKRTWQGEVIAERVHTWWEKRFSYEKDAAIKVNVNSFNHEKGYVNCHVTVSEYQHGKGMLDVAGPFRLKLVAADFENNTVFEKAKAVIIAKRGTNETAKITE